MNENSRMHPLLQRYVPPVAGVIAFVTFVSLGNWQLDRAAEKNELSAMFADDAPAVPLGDIEEPVLYQWAESRGRFLPGKQVLVDNIVREARLGFFVITPFEVSRNLPLVLVNRGWVEKRLVEEGEVNLELDASDSVIRGRVGNLPRVAIRGGDGFADSGDEWPRRAVYPTIDEVARELDRDVEPVVLLMDPADSRGFERNWAPVVSGPSTHYGYAFQWFAMALAVVVIAGWQWNKRRSTS